MTVDQAQSMLRYLQNIQFGTDTGDTLLMISTSAIMVALGFLAGVKLASLLSY